MNYEKLFEDINDYDWLNDNDELELQKGGSARKRLKEGLDPNGYCDVPQIQEWKLELMICILLKNILKDKEKMKNIIKNFLSL